MQILLIEPPLFIEKNNKKIFPRFIPYLPLSVAASLEHAGYNVKIYDAFLECADIKDIINVVTRYAPSFIGISPVDITRFPPIEVSIELIKSLKHSFPQIPIAIFGLKEKNILDKLCNNRPEIDYVLLGDPEETMVELIQKIDKKEEIKDIQGLITRDFSKTALDTSQTRIIDNLDRLFFPAMHLINLNRYIFLPHRYKKSKVYPIVSNRGCIWDKCIFCNEASIINAHSYRSRSPEHIVSEIEFAFKKYGDVEIQFYGNQLETDVKWLRKFQSEIITRSLSFQWSCISRVDKVNKEAIEIMRSTGCWNILFGIETSSQRLLDTINKGCTVVQTKKAVQLCKTTGIETTGSFLMGIPNEKPDDVINSVKFAIDIGIDYAQFFIIVWLYDDIRQFLAQGKFSNNWDYSQFAFRGQHFIPNSYKNLAHLKRIQLKAYLMFYFHPKTILNHIKKCRTFTHIKRLFYAVITIIKISNDLILQNQEK